MVALLVTGATPALAQHEPPEGAPTRNGNVLRYVDVLTSEGRCGVFVGGFFSEERKEVVEVLRPRTGTSRTIIRNVTFSNTQTGTSVHFTGREFARLSEAELCAILLPLGI